MTTSARRIEAQAVCKRFIIGGAAPVSDLRERFALPVFASQKAKAERAQAQAASEFWALRDIGFTLNAGETLGIIGHNGSGKSTLLKLLTGIMKPTEGTVKVQGRVGALIEVGAGFHPDLTGRENVYLNGSILGLSRREIAAKFDEIVAFAGLERFIDTPVKRYSSGMYMRLGFAVASHINPDILLIDEVLAVGDAQFQRKCLRRLKEFVAQGGTAVFVSHAAAQVADFCERCLWLDHGRLMYDGPSSEALRLYSEHMERGEQNENGAPSEPASVASKAAEAPPPLEAAKPPITLDEELEERDRAALLAEAEHQERARRDDPSRAYIFGVRIVDENHNAQSAFQAGETVRLQVDYRLGENASGGAESFDPAIGLQIHRADGLYMFGGGNHDQDITLTGLPLSGVLTVSLPAPALNEGRYYARLYLARDGTAGDFHAFPPEGSEDTLSFTVSAGRRAHGVTFMNLTYEPSGASGGAVVSATPLAFAANAAFSSSL